jgi:hypothetical protein
VTPRNRRSDGSGWIPVYVFHVLNAFDDGDAVVIDVVRYERAFDTGAGRRRSPRGSPCWPAGRSTPRHRPGVPSGDSTTRPSSSRASTARWPGSATATATARAPGGRGPRPARSASAWSSTTWRATRRPGSSRASTGSPGEPVFVRGRPTVNGEDEGWVLSVVHDATRDASDLVILDATAFGGPPVATVHLPARVPFGFSTDRGCRPTPDRGAWSGGDTCCPTPGVGNCRRSSTSGPRVTSRPRLDRDRRTGRSDTSHPPCPPDEPPTPRGSRPTGRSSGGSDGTAASGRRPRPPVRSGQAAPEFPGPVLGGQVAIPTKRELRRAKKRRRRPGRADPAQSPSDLGGGASCWSSPSLGYGYFRYQWEQGVVEPVHDVCGRRQRPAVQRAADRLGQPGRRDGGRGPAVRERRPTPGGSGATPSRSSGWIRPRGRRRRCPSRGDTYVTRVGDAGEQPAGRSQNKINAAFGAGPDALIQTIESTFGIPISHYIVINFFGLEDAVNALGGISMDFPYPVRDQRLLHRRLLQQLRPQHPQCRLPGPRRRNRRWLAVAVPLLPVLRQRRSGSPIPPRTSGGSSVRT